MDLMALTLKTSLILTLGMLAALALRSRSAAVRHWMLALTVFGAAAVPVIGGLTPSWSMPTISVPVSERRPDVDVSFSPVARPATAILAPVQDSDDGRNVVRATVLSIWLIGIAINLSLLVIGMVRLHHLGSSPSFVVPVLAERVERVAAIFGLRRRVALVRSDRGGVIVTWGVIHPKIVLPTGAGTWSRTRLDVVLAHEIAHITRGDWLVQIAAEVCKAIYWFNPLFRMACARLRYESECACDDAVINIGVTSHSYATELLELARSSGRQAQSWLPAPAMAARRSNLERRVRAMLNARLDRSPITRGGRWTSALVVLAMTLPIATFAQGGFATVSGTVVDPQDRVLPASTIIVSDARRDATHETKTDRSGHFELVGLPAGDYTIEAKVPGFRALRDTFSVNGQPLDRTLKMQVAELQETITVVSDDGAVTSTRQRGDASAKRPNSTCAAAATDGSGGNLRPPRKVKHVAPGYPGVDGKVQLVATIGTDGSVTDVQVAKADRPELEPVAIDAVHQWEFDSTLLNCIPIEVQMNVSITFRRGQVQ
jgi:beta-lactamase regulating signal transducer with metallopeptidase domain